MYSLDKLSQLQDSAKWSLDGKHKQPQNEVCQCRIERCPMQHTTQEWIELITLFHTVWETILKAAIKMESIFLSYTLQYFIKQCDLEI